MMNFKFTNQNEIESKLSSLGYVFVKEYDFNCSCFSRNYENPIIKEEV